MVGQHEADRTYDFSVLVFDRHAGHDQLLAAEFHDIQKNRFAGLGHTAHQAVGDNLLDRTPDRFRDAVEAERVKVFFVDIDSDMTLRMALQQMPNEASGETASASSRRAPLVSKRIGASELLRLFQL